MDPAFPALVPRGRRPGGRGAGPGGSWSLIKCLIVNHVHQYLGWARVRGPSASGALSPFLKGKNHIGRSRLRPSVLKAMDAPWDPHCLHLFITCPPAPLALPGIAHVCTEQTPDTRADCWGPQTPGCPFTATVPPCQTQDQTQGQTKTCRPGQLAQGHWRNRPVDPGDSPRLGFTVSLQPPLLSPLEVAVSGCICVTAITWQAVGFRQACASWPSITLTPEEVVCSGLVTPGELNTGLLTALAGEEHNRCHVFVHSSTRALTGPASPFPAQDLHPPCLLGGWVLWRPAAVWPPPPGCPCLRLSCPPAPAAVGKPRRPKGSRRWAPSVLPEASRAPLFLCLMLPGRTAGGEGGKAGKWGLS
ncbi:uncharacterized protein LOC115899050 [Rhinopithecus roxellana]|uniref:uncharacterized protein LOC115899050 n=1 Tax=Rhinopithecus roxellana TaxID=61622 RepID=UPI0012373624|nr:uncharacterized protein LOC115899050 [Rhinopithecus roxellana]